MPPNTKSKKFVLARALSSYFLWGGLLLIAGGGLATLGMFPGDGSDYLLQISIASLLWIFASTLMATCRNIQPAYFIGVALLVAYYGKFYLTFSAPDTILTDWRASFIDASIKSPAGWIETYECLNLALVGFTLSLLVASLFSLMNHGGLSSEQGRLRGRVLPMQFHVEMAKFFVWFIPLLMAITSVVMLFFDIGRMGEDTPEALPFRLGGWMVYIRVVILPYALLCYIRSSQEIEARGHSYVAVSLLVLFALSDMLLRSSKGTLVLALIMLLILLWLTNKLTKKHFLLFGAMLATAVILFPFMASYRIVRLLYPGDSLLEIVLRSIDMISEYGTVVEIDSGFFGMAIASFFGRLQGVDDLVMIFSTNLMPLYDKLFDVVSVESYLDEAWGKTGNAPSMLGFFYLISGKSAIAYGMFFWTSFCLVTWHFLNRVALFNKPVIQTWFLYWMTIMSTEGTFDLQLLILLTSFSMVIFTEFLGRRIVRRYRRGLPADELARDYRVTPVG